MKLKPQILMVFAVLAGVAGALAVFLLVRVFAGGNAADDGAIRYFEAPIPAGEFELTTTSGETVTLDDFRGKYLALYFGYTTCPDFCPATMSTWSQALALLGDQAEQIQVVFVSVDPERDTPEKLAEYMTFFNPDFIALTGSADAIRTAADNYYIYYAKNEDTGSAAGYLIDHTVTVQLVSPDGEWLGVMPFDVTPEEMAADLRKMLRR